MEISIIFPIAGLGSRFGYTFKPFLKATDDTFIELAKKPFDRLKSFGYQPIYYFIYRKSQELDYSVTSQLNKLFPEDTIHGLIIDDTDGPLQTLQQATLKYNLKGPAFVCDCDHSIQIDPMIESIDLLEKMDVFIPTWNIEEKDYIHWGKIKLNKDYQIVDFCEKEYMKADDGCYVKGLIGCYLFKHIESVLQYPAFENISSMLKKMHQEGKPMIIIPILEADFFGTPKSLQDFRFKRAQPYSIFIDIDGTLIHQTTRKLLPGTLDKLNYWKSQGHRIILTTAIDKHRIINILSLLKEYQIPYDDIITGLPPGPRFLINDRKPYIPYYCMASGYVIDRDYGIGEIELPIQPPTIIKLLKGASFAQVYLVEDTKRHLRFVRKYISKNGDLEIHADILKRQCEDLKRLFFYKKNICPKILNEYDSPSEYYYDMEYLEGYQTLSSFNDETIYSVLPKVLEDMNHSIYSYKKQIPKEEQIKWLQDYLDEKVYPKFKIIEDLHPELHKLIHLETIIINNKKYQSIQHYLEHIQLSNYTPEVICPIHGDLTLENILYHPETHDYKLIDPSGARYMDAIEMDIAKLFQSIVCNYASWNDCTDLVKYTQDGYFINKCYMNDSSKINGLYDDKIYKKGIFYMSTYFVRMVPFMLHKSLEHALHILLLAIYYLDSIATN